jgi:rhodanese-related sulfurtransferase
MQRRYKEHRHHHRNSQDRSRRNSLGATLRKPGTQVAILLVVALIVFIILQMGADKTPVVSFPATVTVSDAYNMYETGAFILDVRTVEEWNEFHIPNTQLIPLDELPSRLNEVPRGRQIIVVCRSGNRSQQGRDILLNAGFEQVTSMTGGLTEWRAGGYPTEP